MTSRQVGSVFPRARPAPVAAYLEADGPDDKSKRRSSGRCETMAYIVTLLLMVAGFIELQMRKTAQVELQLRQDRRAAAERLLGGGASANSEKPMSPQLAWAIQRRSSQASPAAAASAPGGGEVGAQVATTTIAPGKRLPPPPELRMKNPAAPLRIPRQLVVTSKEATPKQLPGLVQDNLKKTLKLSPGMRLRFLSDADCAAFVRKNCDTDIADFYDQEVRGSYRGDICRVCVLAHEGGFYLDLDVQMYYPVDSLVDERTTFFSTFSEDGAVLNAMMGVIPNSPVMLEALNQLKMWYRGEINVQAQETTSEWMGPVTMLRALRQVARQSCGRWIANRLQWECGREVFLMYREAPIDCWRDVYYDQDGKDRTLKECPPVRAENEFPGVKFGIYGRFESGSYDTIPATYIVAWPRFEACQNWGCSAGGWDERPVLT